ncbi:MAG: hypothetical protein AMS25_17575 [Gemmatimonas sp. SM23_52]|nr:MAG: hypothetical protein AMS25_17575 [Gemmatimonas sp. SM23_52]
MPVAPARAPPPGYPRRRALWPAGRPPAPPSRHLRSVRPRRGPPRPSRAPPQPDRPAPRPHTRGQGP